jgi:hypothetical protein
MELWMKIAWAVVLGILVIRLWPMAKQWLEHGPKGSSEDWRGILLPLAAVVGFVLLLIWMVRGG